MSNSITIFAEDLQKNLLEKGVKTSIIRSLSDLCNCFGNHDDEIAEVVLRNKTTKKNFLLLTSICGIYMGYTRRCEIWQGREHFDDRNRASMKYCHLNYEKFLEIFEKQSGVTLCFKDNPEHHYFFDDCLLGRRGTFDTPIANEVKRFANDHPTLQQEMMGVFIRIIGNNKLVEGIEATGFPFI